MSELVLHVHRVVPASVERVWQAWTQPDRLARWWGPRGVDCVGVEIDLRVGGAYAIGHRAPDGSELWIRGHFERVEPPERLVYTWSLHPAEPTERVTVRFTTHAQGTSITILHERIATEGAREQHGAGWRDCLDGLVAYVTTAQ